MLLDLGSVTAGELCATLDWLRSEQAFIETTLARRHLKDGMRGIDPITVAGKHPVIPPKGNRKRPRGYDKHIYKARRSIKNFFAELKQYRAIATRCDKTARNFSPPSTAPPLSFGSIDDTPEPGGQSGQAPPQL